jgi:hypothetical protein
MAATRDDWKVIPLPTARKNIPFDGHYTAEEFEWIKEGTIPSSMDDRWFAFYEKPWLYLHRGWTGHCVYQVRFEPIQDEFRVSEVLVNRDPDQYPRTDDTHDAALLSKLLSQLSKHWVTARSDIE